MELSDADVSARVLLRQVLRTEPPSSPVTRSMTQEFQQNSGTRHSARFRRSVPGLKSPHMALRQKLKDRLHESASRSPVQHKKRTLPVEASRNKSSAPASSLPLDEDDITARGLLRGILQTEPEMSLLVPDWPTKSDNEPSSTESSLHNNQPSMGTSDLELPDLTVASVTSAIRGISRKRPQKNIDLSVFVRKLDEGGGETDEPHLDKTNNLSALSACSLSQDSLSLKTPYVDPHTEKRGLRRAVKRRTVDVDNFEEGVQNHLARKTNSDMEQSITESRPLEKFTLGFTDLTAVETTDIIMSSTTLYPLPPSQNPAVTVMKIQGNGAEEVHKQAEDKQWPLELASSEKEEEQETEMGDEYEEADQWPSNNEESLKGVKREAQKGKSLWGEEQLERVEGLRDSEEQGMETVEEQEVVQPSAQEHILESCIKNASVAFVEQGEEGPSDELQIEEGGDKSQRTAGMCISNPNEEEELSDPLHQTGRLRSEEQASAARHIARHRFYRSEGGIMLPGKMKKGWDYRRLSADVQHVNKEFGGVPKWVDRDQGEKSSDDEPSGGCHSGPEEVVRNQEMEGSHLLSSPHMQPPSPEHRDPFSRKSLWAAEPTGAGQTNEGEVLLDTDREIFTEDLQNKENWSPNQNLEADMSPLQTPTRGAADPGLASKEEGDSEGENEEDDGFQSEELSMKTPAFVRQKRSVQTPEPQTTPNFLKTMMNTRQFPQAAAAASKPKPPRKRQASSVKKESGLPRSYLMSIFKHFAKTKVSPDIYPVLKEIMDKYFDRLAEDLEAYAAHAKRRTIEMEDVELLLRRQGFVTDSMPVNVLIEKHLPQEYRKLLIPVATSGNKVVPKQRR